MKSIVAQHFFNTAELSLCLLLRLMMRDRVLPLISLLLRSKFFAIHNTVSSALVKKNGKCLARAMELSADRIGRLLGQRGDFFIAQLFIGNQ